ncbi:hypothetical protein BKA62DRAFT_775014 [Auriculariales sp. MPI-PUGE-AT-0066]|nr:hypothetical protein BKA62DRAFT_775014 [Auriculariales sp. MPI-PUGE-AT-0066]
MATPAPAPDSETQTLLYPPNVLHNSAVQNTKFYAASLAGAVAGTLGWQNWSGFALFAFTMLLSTGVTVVVSCKGQPEKYFKGGFWELVNPGQDNLMSFILAWTLFYGIVHVYD